MLSQVHRIGPPDFTDVAGVASIGPHADALPDSYVAKSAATGTAPATALAAPRAMPLDHFDIVLGNRLGREILAGQHHNALLLIGMSLRNSYFTRRATVAKIVSAAKDLNERCGPRTIGWIQPIEAAATFRALDLCTPEKARQRAHYAYKNVRTNFRQEFERQNFAASFLWSNDYTSSAVYEAARGRVRSVYAECTPFRDIVRCTTRAVLAKASESGGVSEEQLDIGQEFFLDEIAFLLHAPVIIQEWSHSTELPYVSFIYHHDIAALASVLNGDFSSWGLVPSDHMGWVVYREFNSSSVSPVPSLEEILEEFPKSQPPSHAL